MKDLRISPSSFAEAMALQRAVAKAVKTTDIKLGELADGVMGQSGDMQLGDIEIGSDSVETIVKTVLSLGISKEIEACLFACAERAVYKEEKVNPDFFESPEHWELYYPIMFEIAKVNISPFFKSLGTLFSGLTQRIKGKSPEQK